MVRSIQTCDRSDAQPRVHADGGAVVLGKAASKVEADAPAVEPASPRLKTVRECLGKLSLSAVAPPSPDAVVNGVARKLGNGALGRLGKRASPTALRPWRGSWPLLLSPSLVLGSLHVNLDCALRALGNLVPRVFLAVSRTGFNAQGRFIYRPWAVTGGLGLVRSCSMQVRGLGWPVVRTAGDDRVQQEHSYDHKHKWLALAGCFGMSAKVDGSSVEEIYHRSRDEAPRVVAAEMAQANGWRQLLQSMRGVLWGWCPQPLRQLAQGQEDRLLTQLQADDVVEWVRRGELLLTNSLRPETTALAALPWAGTFLRRTRAQDCFDVLGLGHVRQGWLQASHRLRLVGLGPGQVRFSMIHDWMMAGASGEISGLGAQRGQVRQRIGWAFVVQDIDLRDPRGAAHYQVIRDCDPRGPDLLCMFNLLNSLGRNGACPTPVQDVKRTGQAFPRVRRAGPLPAPVCQVASGNFRSEVKHRTLRRLSLPVLGAIGGQPLALEISNQDMDEVSDVVLEGQRYRATTRGRQWTQQLGTSGETQFRYAVVYLHAPGSEFPTDAPAGPCAGLILSFALALKSPRLADLSALLAQPVHAALGMNERIDYGLGTAASSLRDRDRQFAAHLRLEPEALDLLAETGEQEVSDAWNAWNAWTSHLRPADVDQILAFVEALREGNRATMAAKPKARLAARRESTAAALTALMLEPGVESDTGASCMARLSFLGVLAKILPLSALAPCWALNLSSESRHYRAETVHSERLLALCTAQPPVSGAQLTFLLPRVAAEMQATYLGQCLYEHDPIVPAIPTGKQQKRFNDANEQYGTTLAQLGDWLEHHPNAGGRPLQRALAAAVQSLALGQAAAPCAAGATMLQKLRAVQVGAQAVVPAHQRRPGLRGALGRVGQGVVALSRWLCRWLGWHRADVEPV